MKVKTDMKTSCLYQPILTVVVLAALATPNALADKYKANIILPLNQAASWTNNAVPEGTEFGVWSSIVTGPMTNELGGDMTWGGIKILDPGGPISIAADGNALTLNGVSGTGIDMSNATQDLTVNCGLTLAASQSFIDPTNRMLTVGGVVSGSGALTKSGFGTLTLSGSNSFASGVNISQGSLWIKNSNALGTGSKTVTCNNGTLGHCQLHLDGTGGNLTLPSGINYLVSNWGDPGTVYNESGNNVINGNFTVTSGGGGLIFLGNAGSLTINGTITPDSSGRGVVFDGPGNNTVNGVISDGANYNFSFIQQGVGTTTLTAANTYKGTTDIRAGALLVNGSLASASVVTVKTNATLGGNGIIGGPVTVQAGATLSPGIGIGWIGRMAISNTLTLAGTTAMDLNKAAVTNDQVRGITTLTYGGTLVVTNLAGTLAVGDSFKLFDAANYAGSFAAISPATPGIGITWDRSYLPVDGTLRVVALPIQNYSINIPANKSSLVANQLDHAGGNTLANVFSNQLTYVTEVYFWKGSGDDPANTAQLLASTNYDIYYYDPTDPAGYGTAVVWYQDDDFTPINASSIYVNPGQGVFIKPSAPVTLTFTGTPHVPVLPATLPYGSKCWNLLSRQTNDIGTYENVTGLAPAEGTRLFRWNVTTQTFTTNNYSAGVWSSGAPNLGVGEAAFFLVSATAGERYKTNNPANLNIAGSWSNNAAPGGSDFAIWNSLVTAPNTTNALGTNLTWGCIKILNPGATINITGSNTLTLIGVSGIGIDTSNAVQDLTVACPVSVISTQAWAIGPGRNVQMKNAVFISAPFTIVGPGSARINTMEGEGVYPVDFTGSSFTQIGLVDGALSMQVDGSATLALTGINSCTGPAAVNNGTLQLQSTASNTVAGVCSALGTNTLTLNDGATFQLLADTNTTFTGGANTVTFGNVTVNVGPLTAGGSNQTVSLGAASLICSGSNNIINFVGGTNGYILNAGEFYTHGGPLHLVTLGVDVRLEGISSNGVYPVDFTGSSYGSPSEIEWNFGDGSKDTDTCGPIKGVASFTKSGNKPLKLTGTNIYSGPTIIRDGPVLLSGQLLGGGPVTIQNDGEVQLVVANLGSSGQDGVVSGSVTVESGGTLTVVNIGSSGYDGVVCGPVSIEPGGCLAAGINIWELADGRIAVSSTLSLAGTTLLGLNRTNTPNCGGVDGISTVTYGGTLTVTNRGPALQAGDTFTLFSAAYYVGAFATLNLPSLNSNLVWDTSSLQVNGSIRVASSPVTYAGLVHGSLGYATLNYVPTNTLIVGNLGSSGLDGVMISLPTNAVGWAAQWEPLDPAGTLPIGSYLQEQVIGTCGSVTNGVLATLTTTKAGASNFVLYADFSPIGATNFTVQAYYGGNLVAEATQVGPAGPTGSSSGWPDDWEIDWSGGWPTIKPTWHNDPIWFTPTVGPAVLADSVMIIPGGVSGPSSVSSVTIQAAQIPSITITNENVSLLYQGLVNTSIGQSSLSVSNTAMVVANIGSSGYDGVSIALPSGLSGLDVRWQALDVSNTLPVGAYVQQQMVGMANGITNGVLGKVTVTKTGKTNCLVSADFSPLGASTYTVQAYLHGVLVGQATNQTGASLVNCVGGSGGWAYPTSVDIEWDITHNKWWATVDWSDGTTTRAQVGGLNVTCDVLYITPENVPLNTPTAMEITASQVPVITITSENASFVYQGLMNTSLGNATLNYVPTNTLILGNIGSSGQDGVSIAWPTNLSGLDVVCQQLEITNTLPVGAYVQEGVIGTGNGITNGVLGTVTWTKTGPTNYLISASSQLGASTYTVRAYCKGVLVAQATNQPGSSLLGVAAAAVGGEPFLDYGWKTTVSTNNGTITKTGYYEVTGGGWVLIPLLATVAFDTIDIIPENVPASNPTAFTITASQVPAITITSENASFVYQGLMNTSLGNAALGVSDNHLTVVNIGISGEDGVSIALPGNGAGWSGVLQDLDPTGVLPIGACLRAQMIGTGGTVVYGLLGTVQATKVGTSNIVITADFSPIGVSTCTVQVYNGNTLVTQVTGQTGSVLGMCVFPLDCHFIYDPTNGWNWVLTWNGQPIPIFPIGGSAVVGDRVVISPEGAPALVPAAVQITASQIPQITFTSESLVASQPAPISIQAITGGFNLNWPANQGWTLQETTNLIGPWNDVTTTSNAYQVVPTPTQPNQFFRLRSGP